MDTETRAAFWKMPSHRREMGKLTFSDICTHGRKSTWEGKIYMLCSVDWTRKYTPRTSFYAGELCLSCWLHCPEPSKINIWGINNFKLIKGNREPEISRDSKERYQAEQEKKKKIWQTGQLAAEKNKKLSSEKGLVAKKSQEVQEK